MISIIISKLCFMINAYKLLFKLSHVFMISWSMKYFKTFKEIFKCFQMFLSMLEYSTRPIIYKWLT